MKKIKFLFTLCAACILLASCSDVPMPYIDPKKDDPSNVKKLPYTSSSLSTDWTMVYETNNPWSQGSSYAQATGFQLWGGSEKSNKEVTGTLVSPPISTKTDSGNVYFNFDYTIRYENKVPNWQDNHKIFITTDISEGAKIDQIDFTPIASTTNDWTLYNSGNILLPKEYVNQDSIYILFYFYAPASASTTWELANFEIGEGTGVNPGPKPVGDDIFNAEFSSSLDPMKNYTTSGEGGWINDFKTAKATGYDNASKTTTAGTYYLVSPAISLEEVDTAHVDYNYILRYNKGDENQELLISTSFDPSNPTANWTVLNNKHTEGTDWATFANSKVDIPESYMGKTIYLAFKYNTDNVSGSTWEVRDVAVKKGSANKPGPDPKPVGDNLIANGDFETWSGSTAVGWQSTTTASTAGAVTQSTDAHTGSYSAQIAGATAANKRIAYKEITLAPGTYNIKFWAKSTGAKSSVNPGYVAVEGGKVSGSYVYTDYVDIPNTWTEVSKSFTLSAQTTVNLVIMNSKNPGVNVLIDDYELTTSDGGIIGNDTPPTPPTPSDNSIPYSITFTSTQGDWTINDVQIASGLNYVWQQNSTYGMKASGYYQKAFDAESWLISPQFEIPAAGATLSLSHAMNYLNSMNRAECIDCKVSTDKTNWTSLSLSVWPAGSDFNFVDATASLAKYAGQKIYIGFQYKSTSAGAVTYEIKSLSIR